MGTHYYRLKPPVTYVYVSDRRTHDEIDIWIDHEFAGSLRVVKSQTASLLRLFCAESPALRTSWGGKDNGMELSILQPVSDDEALVSEYGKLTTANQLKERVRAQSER